MSTTRRPAVAPTVSDAEPLAPLDDATALARVGACIDTALTECGPGFAHGYLTRMAANVLTAQGAYAALSVVELSGDPLADTTKPLVTERRSRFSAGARIRREDSI